MRILYVEDNPANVFLVKRVAKMGQHEIINFIDGREAIRKYDDVDPDLVLMDIQLVGETSGLEVVKELRARGVQTPIIAVTAYAMVGDKERCIEAGCNDYLAKPLPIPRLIEIFQSYEITAKKIRDTQTQRAIAEAAKAEQEKAEAVQASVAPTETQSTHEEVKVEPETESTPDTAKAETTVETSEVKASAEPTSETTVAQDDVPPTRRLPASDEVKKVIAQPTTSTQEDSTQPTKPKVTTEATTNSDADKADTTADDTTTDDSKVEPSTT